MDTFDKQFEIAQIAQVNMFTKHYLQNYEKKILPPTEQLMIIL